MAEAKRVFLHIGAPKTGTTYLQRVLAANRDRLADQGVLYPSVGGEAHHVAAWGLRPDKGGDTDSGTFGPHWGRLVEEVLAWSGDTVVVSSEMFVFFPPRQADEVLSAFGDAEVHVVYTARDLVRQVPAVWQEQVKNQMTQSYRSYVRDLLGPRATPMARHFWRAQDAPKALRRWRHGLDPAHVHVVTAPPAGAAPTLLWERFAEAIGVDGTSYDAVIPVANTSLGAAAAEVLRRYNARHAGDLPIRSYRRQVMRPLTRVLVDGVTERSKLPLSTMQRSLLARRSRRIVEGIRTAGYDVVGSLDDLVPPQPTRMAWSRAGRGPDDLSDEQVIDALLDVVHEMLAAQQRRPGPRPGRTRRRGARP